MLTVNSLAASSSCAYGRSTDRGQAGIRAVSASEENSGCFGAAALSFEPC